MSLAHSAPFSNSGCCWLSLEKFWGKKWPPIKQPFLTLQNPISESFCIVHSTLGTFLLVKVKCAKEATSSSILKNGLVVPSYTYFSFTQLFLKRLLCASFWKHLKGAIHLHVFFVLFQVIFEPQKTSNLLFPSIYSSRLVWKSISRFKYLKHTDK